MTVPPERLQALYLSRQGQAAAFRPQTQQHRESQRIGHMPGAGAIRDTAQTGAAINVLGDIEMESYRFLPETDD